MNVDVSVLGLGQMGSAIAERLIGAGHKVSVWNRSKGKADDLVAGGAFEMDALSEAWARSDVCITMVADSHALAEVALAPHGGLVHAAAGRGKTLIDMSTVSAEVSGYVAAAATAGGVKYLRAPVSGNPGVVRAGNLTIVASGDEDVFTSAESLLRDIGPHLFYVGEGDAARIIKLALNLMVAGTAELLAECVALAEAHDVRRDKLLEVVGASAVASPLVKYKIGPLLANDYTSTFSSRLMRKDLDLALEAAAAGGVPLPVTGVVQQLLQGCMSTGLGELDFMALLIRLQREAGQTSD
ncbi:NAD(P)-dependent oxidoreductase [Streptomyces chiangmaiensis]|uniref:NAD(P)-dependent oxidoreductase n=1 Tax=Streptomyces chiangmaiensis TaxID=766497 RepID=A0ABU7FEV7_9ACTN|nr:NAD(P)-dependent oxidoreductase [Streptomyces chiangmaiensis]MED7822097.1 NAD(P)-dependent oxidoreductase [Streptomyces chiangmaiensis]